MEIELKQAVDTLAKALREDKSEGSYYYSWQANIAMAFKDEYDRAKNRHTLMTPTHIPFEPNIHEIANTSAKNFLDLLCREVNEEKVQPDQ